MITEKPVQSHGIKCLFHKDEYKLYNMTRSTVYRKAHSAFLQGKSIDKIANDLQEHMKNMERSSAIRTARTAVTSAQNAGRMDSYIAAEKMGIKLKREWVATLDNRTRHAHAMLDGQKAELDKPFKVDGYSIMFPGDTSAPGYLVYNCRCTIVADIEGIDTSDAQRWSNDGVIPNMTYQEWENKKQTRQKIVGTTQISRYNDSIKEHVNLDAHEVYISAKNGERNKGVYVDAIKKRQKNLEKSIASHTAQVEEHADKIRNPERYDVGWNDKNDRQKQGLLKKWRKDLQRNAEQAEIEIEVWKERFGNEQ